MECGSGECAGVWVCVRVCVNVRYPNKRERRRVEIAPEVNEDGTIHWLNYFLNPSNPLSDVIATSTLSQCLPGHR